MSREKAAVPDGIYSEFIEALDEVGIEQMTKLANEIYDGSKFPAKMCKSISITVPPKNWDFQVSAAQNYQSNQSCD